MQFRVLLNMCPTCSKTAYHTINSFLNIAQVTIDNALNNPPVLDSLSQYGYTRDRIQHGKTLYETAMTTQQWQKTVHSDQISATANLNQTWEISQKSYRQLFKAARIAFKYDLSVITRLNLNSKRKRSLSIQLLQAQQFYINLLNSPELIDALKAHGVTASKLKVAQAEMEAVQSANLAHEKGKAAAQAAAQARDTAMDNLRIWLSDFITIARIALGQHPQLLETSVFATLPEGLMAVDREFEAVGSR